MDISFGLWESITWLYRYISSMMVIALVLFIGTLSQYGYVGQKVLVITLFSNEMDN
jgi:hypothetical protein